MKHQIVTLQCGASVGHDICTVCGLMLLPVQHGNECAGEDPSNPNPDVHQCWTCGCLWKHGESGDHRCSEFMVPQSEMKTLRANLERLAERWKPDPEMLSGHLLEKGSSMLEHALCGLHHMELLAVLAGMTPPPAGEEWTTKEGK